MRASLGRKDPQQLHPHFQGNHGKASANFRSFSPAVQHGKGNRYLTGGLRLVPGVGTAGPEIFAPGISIGRYSPLHPGGNLERFSGLEHFFQPFQLHRKIRHRRGGRGGRFRGGRSRRLRRGCGGRFRGRRGRGHRRGRGGRLRRVLGEVCRGFPNQSLGIFKVQRIRITKASLFIEKHLENSLSGGKIPDSGHALLQDKLFRQGVFFHGRAKVPRKIQRQETLLEGMSLLAFRRNKSHPEIFRGKFRSGSSENVQKRLFPKLLNLLRHSEIHPEDTTADPFRGFGIPGIFTGQSPLFRHAVKAPGLLGMFLYICRKNLVAALRKGLCYHLPGNLAPGFDAFGIPPERRNLPPPKGRIQSLQGFDSRKIRVGFFHRTEKISRAPAIPVHHRLPYLKKHLRRRSGDSGTREKQKEKKYQKRQKKRNPGFLFTQTVTAAAHISHPLSKYRDFFKRTSLPCPQKGAPFG